MTKSIERIRAIIVKEMRISLRFPLEYFISQAASPIKSSVMIFFLYRGFLKGTSNVFGEISESNYVIFTLVGTCCHSLFMTALSTFRHKMIAEKYWQTVTATFLAPTAVGEVIVGYILGSVGVPLLMSAAILISLSLAFAIPLKFLFAALTILCLICILGFGLGLIGTTFALVWEGKAWIFDYGIQAVVFMSCFYYPLKTLPAFLHPMVGFLPTYRASTMIQNLYVFGTAPNFEVLWFYILVWSVALVVLPALFLDYAVRRWGITGY